MKAFRRRLAEINPESSNRRWLYVPYDQLSDQIGPLSRELPEELGIVLVESRWKASRRPYHQQKLALLLSNMRHFALEQAERGVAVRHVVTDAPYAAALRPLIAELGPLRMMEAAERELRCDLEALVRDKGIEVLPHEGWLSSPEQFAALGQPPWRMDSFYRRLRRASGILMDKAGRPLGGKLSLDAENRKPWRGQPPAPEPPRFEPDAISEEVGDLVARHFAHHPGTLDLGQLPASAAQVQDLWCWAQRECLTYFGPYEDAMSVHSRGLFHTRISPLLNLHRLLPRTVVDDVLEMDLPLSSKEGFVRQVIGWREFVRHVHRATDGFRHLPSGKPTTAVQPGVGGWDRWQGRAWEGLRGEGDPDGGACPSHLEADWDLPPAFWGQHSGLNCLDQVVDDVWQEGWSHHITRLMVLSNIATLLDVEPRQLTDWFWVAYIDAYDWVVEPNVLAMGSFAVGDLMTTKPYISGSAYLNRMSDYCAACAFDPKNNCPITLLYWAFLARHADRLADNPRLRMPLRSLSKRSPERCREDRRTFEQVRRALEDGRKLQPDTGDSGTAG